jgi:hypothetical protein
MGRRMGLVAEAEIFESAGAGAGGGIVQMILSILAAWTAVSILTGLAIAPALAGRLN